MYAGATIDAINGVPALKAILQWALTYGFVSKGEHISHSFYHIGVSTSLDPGVLFNSALSSGFSQVPLVLYPVPTDARTYSLTLKDGTKKVVDASCLHLSLVRK